MADEEVMGSASPAPSDQKRKLDDLDSEPFEQPPASAGSNGNSESVADADGDVAAVDPDAKRPRLDDNPDVPDATENGHQGECAEEPKEDLIEPSADVNNTESKEDQEKTNEPLDAVKNAELEEDQEKANELLDAGKNTELEEDQEKTNKLLDPVNEESVINEAHTDPVELQPTENSEETAKEEHRESAVEHEDPTSDVALQEDVYDLKERLTSADRPTSRRMEVPSNKVGVLIGKAGDTIRTLQYSSGARIQITRDADADPNSATRSVELIGTLDNINKAESLIKDVIAEADAGGSPSLVARGFSANSSGAGEQIQIQVPNEKVGLIIGKGGETIKNLQTRSGARIQLIPQHLPEGDQSRERTVRVTGDRKQIEAAKEMIKEVMEQPVRSLTPSSGNNQQPYRQRGPHWGGPRGHHHHSQPSGYNNYPQRGAYPSQNPPYSSPGYGNYPPQQMPPKNNYGWDQRPPANIQGPPEQTGYDYYGGAPSSQPPMHSHPPAPAMGPPPSQPNYGYGQPQGPDYGQQPPASYQQPPPQGYGHGYGDSQAPPQHSYGGQSGAQPSPYSQGGTTTHPGYGQPDQYGKPPASYNMPPQGAYPQPYGQPRQQPYPMQQYPQYSNDGYGHSATAGGGYPPQGGQPVSGYAQTGGQQPTPGYGQGPTTGYSQYPSTQTGYTEQSAPNSGGYGYQGAPDPSYGGGPGVAYGAPPAVQPAYSQPAPAQALVQPGYDQSIPQTGGYVNPQQQPQAQAQAQPGYGQYDSSQMYR